MYARLESRPVLRPVLSDSPVPQCLSVRSERIWRAYLWFRLADLWLVRRSSDSDSRLFASAEPMAFIAKNGMHCERLCICAHSWAQTGQHWLISSWEESAEQSHGVIAYANECLKKWKWIKEVDSTDFQCCALCWAELSCAELCRACRVVSCRELLCVCASVWLCATPWLADVMPGATFHWITLLLLVLVAVLCRLCSGFNVDTVTSLVQRGPSGTHFGFSVSQLKDRGKSWWVMAHISTALIPAQDYPSLWRSGLK